MRTKQVFNYLSKCNRKIKELTKVNRGGGISQYGLIIFGAQQGMVA